MGKCQEEVEEVGRGTVPLLPKEDSSGLAGGVFYERTLKKTTGKLHGVAHGAWHGCGVVWMGRVTVSLSMWLRRLLCQELGGETKDVSFGRIDFFPARSSFPFPLGHGEMKDRWRDEGQMVYCMRTQWREQAMAKTPRMKSGEPWQSSWPAIISPLKMATSSSLVCTLPALQVLWGGKGLPVKLSCETGRMPFCGSCLYCPLLQVWLIFLPGASVSSSLPFFCLSPFIITIWVLLLGTQPSRCRHTWQCCAGM